MEKTMAESITFNEDCMAVMARYPDKYFDLSVVDPPYGAGFTEGGGCQGWFSKYHQTDDKEHRNLRGRFDRYNASASESSQSLHVERERRTGDRRITGSEAQEADSSGTSVIRTGGTWAEKYGKKS